MKRDPALAILSREHHGALLLARLLQKNAPAYPTLPTGIEEKAVYATAFYLKELVPHFMAEEKAFELVKGINTELDQLVVDITIQHQQLHGLFAEIPASTDLATHLDTLGKQLENHIRQEERQLFPLIQESCSFSVMKSIELSLSPEL